MKVSNIHLLKKGIKIMRDNMLNNNVVNYINMMCQWIMKFVYLNILWILFTICGLIIFGIAPATISVFYIQRKWMKGYEDIPIFSTFYQQYKKNFKKSNYLGILLVFIGWLIYFDLQFFMGKDHLFFQIISILMYILSIWYILIILFVVPVYVHYELKFIQNIKYAFIVGMLSPIKNLIMIVCSCGAVFLLLNYPKLIIFFGVSLPTFIIMFFSDQIFTKIESIKKSKVIQ